MTVSPRNQFKGNLYRALNPIYARQPLSGQGAAIYGGRFNAKGQPALYTALDPSTAIREANQVGSLQPTMLVSYTADIGPIFDGTDADALDHYDMSPTRLADPAWRQNMLTGGSVPTQNFAQQLGNKGYVGLKVPSYAKGSSATDLNIVLWDWDDALTVIDQEDRLGRM